MFTYLSITIVFVIGMFMCLPKTRIPANLPTDYRLTVTPSFCKGGADDTEKCDSVCDKEESSTFMTIAPYHMQKRFLNRVFIHHGNFTIVVCFIRLGRQIIDKDGSACSFVNSFGHIDYRFLIHSSK